MTNLRVLWHQWFHWHAVRLYENDGDGGPRAMCLNCSWKQEL